jgi:serine/threonine-protein kinase HipA
MDFHCRSTLLPLPEDGLSPAAMRKLVEGQRSLPHRLECTRADLVHERGERLDRFSISGVQDKVSLRLHRGKLAVTTEGGEYILKPIPGEPLPQFQDDVPANEHVTMQIAEQVYDIPVPPNALVDLADGSAAYLVRRFDRQADSSKRPMEDFASLAGKSSESAGRNYKYTGSYEEIANLLRQYSPAYMIEVERFFRQLCFIYMTGNGDAHLKNFSLIASSDGDHVLTPAYDMLCTSVHMPNDTRLALNLFADGFESEAFRENGFYTGTDFIELAERCSISAKRRDKLLAPFQDDGRYALLTDLVRRSFMCEEAKTTYMEICADRRRALLHGL